MPKYKIVISCPMETTVDVWLPNKVAEDPHARTEALLREGKKAMQRKLPAGVWQHKKADRAIRAVTEVKR